MGPVPWGYLVPNVVLAAATTGALLPAPKRRAPLGQLVFLATMGLNEVPFVVAVGITVSTLHAWRQGDLGSAGGVLGLVLALATVAGLLWLLVRAQSAGPAIDTALDRSPGEGWRGRIHPGLASGLRTRVRWARGVLNPFRRRRADVEHVRDLSYGPHSRYNTVDLYRHRSRPGGSPVLVHLHGGTFVSGRKDHESLPLIYRFASRGWLCASANYRVGRDVRFPEYLVDVKRLLGWLHAHAAEFGGDPSVLVVCGNSAGAHLALTAALTEGVAEYQPGFEEADTTVTAAVGLYGYYGRVDGAVTGSSPADHIHRGAPPGLLVHGDHDSAVPVAWAREFAGRLTEGSEAPVVYAELPGAQHAFDLFNSVRTSIVVDRVEAFTAWVRSRAATPKGAGER